MPITLTNPATIHGFVKYVMNDGIAHMEMMNKKASSSSPSKIYIKHQCLPNLTPEKCKHRSYFPLLGPILSYL